MPKILLDRNDLNKMTESSLREVASRMHRDYLDIYQTDETYTKKDFIDDILGKKKSVDMRNYIQLLVKETGANPLTKPVGQVNNTPDFRINNQAFKGTIRNYKAREMGAY